MRLRRLAAALFLMATPLLAGCFQSATLVKLNPDGSGTLEMTTTMTTKTLAHMGALAASAGEDDQANPDTLFSVDAAKTAVDEMGTGVTFVSARRIDTRDRKGIKAVYAFKDIRTLSLGALNAPPGAEIGVVPDTLMDLSFTRLPNGHSLLTVKDGTDWPNPPQAGVDDQQVNDEMDTLFAGLKVDVAIQVGHLIKTNVPYVNGGTVTLLSVDFDQLLAHPGVLEKMQRARSMAGAKAALPRLNGIKINLDPELTIEFVK